MKNPLSAFLERRRTAQRTANDPRVVETCLGTFEVKPSATAYGYGFSIQPPAAFAQLDDLMKVFTVCLPGKGGLINTDGANLIVYRERGKLTLSQVAGALSEAVNILADDEE